MWRNIRTTLKAIVTVLRHPAYSAAAAAAAFLILWIYIWLPNFSFYSGVVFSSDYPLPGKIAMILSSFAYFLTGFTPLARALAALNAVLIGVSISLSFYYFSNRIAALKIGGAGLNGIGVVASLFGIGCGSCGSVLLSSFVGIGGAASFTQRLPFGGYTFDIIGTLLILASVYLTASVISKPAVCKVPTASSKRNDA